MRSFYALFNCQNSRILWGLLFGLWLRKVRTSINKIGWTYLDRYKLDCLCTSILANNTCLRLHSPKSKPWDKDLTADSLFGRWFQQLRSRKGGNRVHKGRKPVQTASWSGSHWGQLGHNPTENFQETVEKTPPSWPTQEPRRLMVYFCHFWLSFMDGWLLPGAKVPRVSLCSAQLEQAPVAGDCPLAERHRSL